MATKCVVCQSTIEKGEYCDAHSIAKKNLEKRFSDWQKAYEKMTWEEYLNRMIEDADIPVGEWAKEVAIYLNNQSKK
ncbi:MAG: hypothetical protein ACTSPM_09355 [Candidatus Heimdallarchaeota archaeon]